ncbi:hypothetical protein GCM10010280_28140 [Streptomyces pilosus]|uniref:Uncharacterized protein n=1 Tax=Streptomyces pilosus TaxID=28893 RepID=A0A918BQ48_9ACTN|nr:hypothetical protein GCM10010280_28140 [Streptomyces pilosus]
MTVLLDEHLQFGQRLFQRAGVDVPQHDGGQGSFVLGRQRQVGAGHGNGSWHARLPVLPMPGSPPGS